MGKLINWLSTRPFIAIIIAMIYYALVIFPHEWVGVNVNKLFGSMPRSTYDLIILIVSMVLLVSVLLFFGKRLLKHRDRKLLLFYFGLTLFFIYLTNSFLFVINIESVHYVQYAIGAILLFGIIGHYYATLFVAFVIALFDEGYQYFYLSPHRTDYFDINDIITDFLGAAFGLLLLKTLSIKAWGNSRKKSTWVFLVPLVLLVAGFLFALSTNFLSIYPSEDQYMLVREMQEGFWTTVPPKVTFHVVGPAEGSLIIPALFLVYFFVFRSTSASQD